MSAAKLLIVNADDLGLSNGVNEGIVKAHTDGIVTSASLMVTAPAAREAAAIARDHPALSIGLHWVGDGPGQRELDIEDTAAVREQLGRQLDLFVSLMGREPTHLDSHHHLHREASAFALFEDMATR